MAIMGTLWHHGCFRSSLIISIPLMLGMLISVMIRSGISASATLSPILPSSAVTTVKASNSKSFAIISRVSALSSTTSILSGTVAFLPQKHFYTRTADGLSSDEVTFNPPASSDTDHRRTVCNLKKYTVEGSVQELSRRIRLTGTSTGPDPLEVVHSQSPSRSKQSNLRVGRLYLNRSPLSTTKSLPYHGETLAVPLSEPCRSRL